jgi:hypothetical protein
MQQQKNNAGGGQENEQVGRDKITTTTNNYNRQPSRKDTSPTYVFNSPKNVATGPNSRAGDDYYGTERELRDDEKQSIINAIEQKRKDFGIKEPNVIISLDQSSQAKKFTVQLQQFLISKGYNVNPAIGISGGTPFKGLDFKKTNFGPENVYLSISVGIIE